MSTLHLRLQGDRATFRPGETLVGGCHWSLIKAPTSIEVRLFYYTQGRGQQDVVMVEKVSIASPPLEGVHKFEFGLPEGPYSFSGKLISVCWAVEAVVFPGQDYVRREFILSPTGREVVWGTIAPPGTGTAPDDGRA